VDKGDCLSANTSYKFKQLEGSYISLHAHCGPWINKLWFWKSIPKRW